MPRAEPLDRPFTCGLVTLLSDFGDGEYAAALRGAVLRANGNARVVDLTHAVPPQDVASGAYILWASAHAFPPGTVHCAVVDPGVGGPRRALAIRAGDHVFVGPDNGLLLPAAQRAGKARAYALPDPGPGVFHGRDAFAPAAARIAAGEWPGLAPVPDPAVPQWWDAERRSWRWLAEGEVLRGIVLRVDPLGNLITSIPRDAVEVSDANLSISVGPIDLSVRVVDRYEEEGEGTIVALGSSQDLLEIACVRGRASDLGDLRPGLPVTVRST